MPTPTLTEQWRQRFGHLPAERLEAASIKSARRARLFAALAAVCLLAGVWLDWRWLPTALLPALWAVIQYVSSANFGDLAIEAKQRETT